MTVPTGTPATWAISWYDRLFIPRSTIASRNGLASGPADGARTQHAVE
jgi:hypothetical protein